MFTFICMIKACCTITQFRLLLFADLIKACDRPVTKVGKFQAGALLSFKQYTI
jgi:hypothetical protein